MFLGGHPDVASLGELNFLGKAIRLGESCTCGAKVRDCQSWAQVALDVQGRTGIDIRSNPYAFRLWDARAVNRIDDGHQTPTRLLAMSARGTWMRARENLPRPLRAYVPLPPVLNAALRNKMLLVEAISRQWGKRVVVDSSKNAREAVELYRRFPEQVKLVLLSRDGRGVYLSRRKAGRDQVKSVSGWRNYYRRTLPLLEEHVLPKALFRLRYEDLASQPEVQGRTLCDFIGIPFDAIMLHLHLGERHMVGGNATRFAPNIGIQLDERWRTQLTREDLAYFNRQGGAEMNHRLGYS
jgi:hypothetical protein